MLKIEENERGEVIAESQLIWNLRGLLEEDVRAAVKRMKIVL